jgi:hypothetical protein
MGDRERDGGRVAGQNHQQDQPADRELDRKPEDGGHVDHRPLGRLHAFALGLERGAVGAQRDQRGHLLGARNRQGVAAGALACDRVQRRGGATALGQLADRRVDLGQALIKPGDGLALGIEAGIDDTKALLDRRGCRNRHPDMRFDQPAVDAGGVDGGETRDQGDQYHPQDERGEAPVSCQPPRSDELGCLHRDPEHDNRSGRARENLGHPGHGEVARHRRQCCSRQVGREICQPADCRERDRR